MAIVSFCSVARLMGVVRNSYSVRRRDGVQSQGTKNKHMASLLPGSIHPWILSGGTQEDKHPHPCSSMGD